MHHSLRIALGLLPLVSCARAAGPRPEGEGVRCTLLRLAPTGDAKDEAPPWSARFRVVNERASPFGYQGFSKETPLFQQEVLRGETWENVPVGWCGTGLVAQSLAPGEALELSFEVPADGNSYRFRFGEPAVVTEGVRVPK